MAALRAAQFEYDNRLPPAAGDDEAAQAEWIDKHATELVLGYQVNWGYRGERGEITRFDLAKAVQDHANQRQIDGKDHTDAFGHLLIAGTGTGSAGLIKDLCAYLLGGHDELKKIAADLLRPVAAKAVAAEQEKEREIQEYGF